RSPRLRRRSRPSSSSHQPAQSCKSPRALVRGDPGRQRLHREPEPLIRRHHLAQRQVLFHLPQVRGAARARVLRRVAVVVALPLGPRPVADVRVEEGHVPLGARAHCVCSQYRRDRATISESRTMIGSAPGARVHGSSGSPPAATYASALRTHPRPRQSHSITYTSSAGSTPGRSSCPHALRLPARCSGSTSSEVSGGISSAALGLIAVGPPTR